MATPLEYITRWAPDYAAVTDIQDWIDEAEDETGTSYCDDETRNKVVAAKTCHELLLFHPEISENDGTGVGTLKSEKEGDLAKAWGLNLNMDGNADHAYYAQTTWGLKALKYRMKCFVLPRNRRV